MLLYVWKSPLLLPLLLLAVLTHGASEASAQENAARVLSPGLYECYQGEIYAKWRLMPQSVASLVDIVRKVEDSPSLNMDLKQLAVALLHRFRQDGIEYNPMVQARPGILPYAVSGEQFYKHSQILSLVPGNALHFPNDTLSALERCSLHAMLSSSVGIFERGDESRTCKSGTYTYQRSRFRRSARTALPKDVEMFSPEKTSYGRVGVPEEDDPSNAYDALPRKHPSSRYERVAPPIARSNCPIENGVVKTSWGSVSGGALLAGIAAGLEHQTVRIGELMSRVGPSVGGQRVVSYSNEATLDNAFLATLAGDLAEVAIVQGPRKSDSGYPGAAGSSTSYVLGTTGNWNSSGQPRYYFLTRNENLQMTEAEIQGGLDGLILASQLPEHYQRFRSSLKLSQVLDMYYGRRGLFNRDIHASARLRHYARVAPNGTLVDQTHSAAVLLSNGLATATIMSEAVLKFAALAVNDLTNRISSMNNEYEHGGSPLSWQQQDNLDEPAVNLTIVLDTSWDYFRAQDLVVQIIEKLDISKYNSEFSILNGQDGAPLLNSTYRLSDLYLRLNETQYEKLTQNRKGFELAAVLEKLMIRLGDQLNLERRSSWGGGKSNVVLFVPYIQATVRNDDREFIHQTLEQMRTIFPDTQVLFFTDLSKKQTWFDYVLDPQKDIVTSFFNQQSDEVFKNVGALQARIKQVPRRLINSRCGANYEHESGSPASVTERIVANSTNYYRIHANYFFTDNTDNPPRIKIQATGVGTSLKICASREPQLIDKTASVNQGQCDTFSQSSRQFELTLGCGDSSYIKDCNPYYISVTALNVTSSQSSCTDQRLCRYPDSMEYRIHYEYLVCRSGASSTLLITPPIVLLLIFQFIL